MVGSQEAKCHNVRPDPNQTVIWRHRRERLSKCTLHGLEERPDMHFVTYPTGKLPDLSGYLALSLDAPVLTRADADHGLFLIDGTWRYAEKMGASLPMERRSLPEGLKTAYPRRQEDERGLASIEALYVAYLILGWETTGLLDNYYWADQFLNLNRLTFNQLCD